MQPKKGEEDDGSELYTDNKGTVLGICGKNYSIIAADTRASLGYEILSRNTSKLTSFDNSIVLGSSGMISDRIALSKELNTEVETYQFDNQQAMGSHEFAQILSNFLYFKRFFPYYTFNILAGFDHSNETKGGVLYNYDAIGSYQKCAAYCTGSGKELGTSVLDAYVKATDSLYTDLSKEEAFEIVKKAFFAIAERDINTGDNVEVYIIEEHQTNKESFKIRDD
eukprot:GAHX01000829.1.p1 GENE.GAHX01000829.1~~GAHX01000829.1.p1  ORF type:complete len:243 (-),score=59.66 GAHX01000829.1:43-714(-)